MKKELGDCCSTFPDKIKKEKTTMVTILCYLLCLEDEGGQKLIDLEFQ